MTHSTGTKKDKLARRAPEDGGHFCTLAFLMESAQPAPVAAPAAVAAPVPAAAVLVMVDGGQYRRLGVATDAVLRMDVTELLDALRRDRDFSKALAGVRLDRCAVTVAASASEEAPSAAEEAARRALQGVVTLRRLGAGVMAADERAKAAAVAGGDPYYLYVRVSLPPPQSGAGGGGGGEQPLGE